MNESSASKSKHPIVAAWDCIIGAGLKVRSATVLLVAFVTLVGLLTYIVLRIHVTYSVQQELALIKSAHYHMTEESAVFKRECAQRLDVLEQTLFGEVLPKQQAMTEGIAQAKPGSPRVSRIEQYQQNTNKEYRERIERLERRLLEHMKSHE